MLVEVHPPFWLWHTDATIDTKKKHDDYHARCRAIAKYQGSRQAVVIMATKFAEGQSAVQKQAIKRESP